MENRYIKNIGDAFSEELQEICLNKTIAVIGAGGCGGYVLEHLARLGVKKIIIFDGDKFEDSNLNRQRFCTLDTLGMNKAAASAESISRINDSIEVIFIEDYLSEDYLDIIFSNNVDIIIHAADCYVNTVELNKCINRCLVHRIPVIRASIYTGRANATLIEPRNLDLWFRIKTSAVFQSKSGPCDYISTLSHYCSLSANLVLELFLHYIKNPDMVSCSLSYEYETMKTSLEYR